MSSAISVRSIIPLYDTLKKRNANTPDPVIGIPTTSPDATPNNPIYKSNATNKPRTLIATASSKLVKLLASSNELLSSFQRKTVMVMSECVF